MMLLKKYMKKTGKISVKYLIILTLSALLPVSIFSSTREPKGRCGDINFNPASTVGASGMTQDRFSSHEEDYQELPRYTADRPTPMTPQQTPTFRDPAVIEQEELDARSRDW